MFSLFCLYGFSRLLQDNIQSDPSPRDAPSFGDVLHTSTGISGPSRSLIIYSLREAFQGSSRPTRETSQDTPQHPTEFRLTTCCKPSRLCLPNTCCKLGLSPTTPVPKDVLSLRIRSSILVSVREFITSKSIYRTQHRLANLNVSCRQIASRNEIKLDSAPSRPQVTT